MRTNAVDKKGTNNERQKQRSSIKTSQIGHKIR